MKVTYLKGKLPYLCALMGFAPQVVYAQTTETAPKQEDEFTPLLRKGFMLYQKGQYDQAILTWKDAYAKRPEAFLYHSIAKAYEKQNKLREALSAALLARDQKKRPLSDKLRAKNERLITTLNTKIKAQRLKAQQEQARRKKLLDAKMYEDRRVTWLTHTGIATTVTGALLTGVGTAYFGKQARDKNDALGRGEYSNIDDYNEKATEVSRLQNQGRVLLFTGAGLIAVGSALIIWDLSTTERVLRDDYTPPSTLKLKLSPSYAEVSWQF